MLQSLKGKLRQWRRRLSLPIPADGLVLDVGSGHNPHPRADVLCDRFLSDDYERGGELVRDRPLVAGDITCLPFKDQAFSYVLCSHVLEHIDAVEEALAELMRVAPAGYIECPSPIAEYLAGRDSHYWLVMNDSGTLVFRRKYRPVMAPELRDFVLDLLKRGDASYLSFYWRHEPQWDVRHLWTGCIDYRVERTATETDSFPKSVVELSSDVHRPPTPEELLDCGTPSLRSHLAHAARRFLRRRYQSGLPVHLTELLQCPVCRGELTLCREDAVVRCAGCSGVYPLLDGEVPQLLPELRREGVAS